MKTATRYNGFEVGYDIPAAPGMAETDVQTPCLIVDLDALDRNITRMQKFADDMGVRLRVHGKMHKSADIAQMQLDGGACGICCQKVSEAEAFAHAGIRDILISNEVCDPVKIGRLARLPRLGARIIVCVDDMGNIADLSAAAQRHGTNLEVLVEVDCGADRCGVAPGQPVVELAKAIAAAPGLVFSGIQAYQGAAQHLRAYEERKAKIDIAIDMARRSVEMLAAEGLPCAIVGGAGTGTYGFEGSSGVYNELQCGSYAFMDADYQRVKNAKGDFLDEFENSLFLLTSVMSHPTADRAVVDAGLKAQSVDSGLPVIFGRGDLQYKKCSDEHGVIDDPGGALKIGDKLRLVPGHCDPTCNVHDWYVGIRAGVVERMMPITARGKMY